MKKFFEEFKSFALKGNMFDMAVGVLIGGAFSGLVKSLTDNIISPLIGLLFQMNLENVGLTIHFGSKTVFFGFGAFLSAVINFIILAFVLFCILKCINKLMNPLKKKNESKIEEKKPTTEELLTEILTVLKDEKKSES